jgi:signal peptidase II
MKPSFRFSIVFLIMILCTGCDQVTKSVAQRSLSSGPSLSLLGDVIRFEYLENTGATLGLGAALPGSVRLLIFVVAIGALTIALLAFALRATLLIVC